MRNMSRLPHLKFFSKGCVMGSCPTTDKIKHRLEKRVLAALMSVLRQLPDELSEMKVNKRIKF